MVETNSPWSGHVTGATPAPATKKARAKATAEAHPLAQIPADCPAEYALLLDAAKAIMYIYIYIYYI